jgi:lactate permease
MLTLLAALPVLTAVGLILAMRQSAMRAGVASLAVALALVTLDSGFQLPGARWLGALTVAGGLTLNLSLVLLGGLVLYRVLQAGGGLEQLSQAVARALPDLGIRVLVLVFGVSVFFESATGFGVGIVVSAPLFLALGLDPRRSGLLALLGQCAVPWGALSIGTVLGAQLTGVPAERIALLGAWLSLPFVLLCGGWALWLVGGAPLLKRRCLELLVSACAMLAVAGGGSALVGIELAGVLAGLGIVALGWLRQRMAASSNPAEPLGRSGLWRALFPLAMLIAALLLTRLVPAVTAITTRQAVLTWAAANLRLPLLHHPGCWLLVASATAVFALRLPLRKVGPALRAALQQWVLATLAVAGFIGMAQLMFQAGMTAQVAESIARATGPAYPLLLPFIAGLGGFLTASNAGANAMLAQLQQILAERLHLSADWVAAAQNAAASNATLASPGRVILAAIVTGEPGAEARLMRPALGIALLGLAGMAALLWAVVG